jgi:hypothetical protein
MPPPFFFDFFAADEGWSAMEMMPVRAGDRPSLRIREVNARQPQGI